MKNISEISFSGFSVLEERFSVLLNRMLQSSDFLTNYYYQPLIVLWEISQFDCAAAEEEWLALTVIEKKKEIIYSLVNRLKEWQKRLQTIALGGYECNLLHDLHGQIEVNITPMFAFDRNFYYLLLASIRLLQSKEKEYLEDICSSGVMDPSLALVVAYLHNYQKVIHSFNERWQDMPYFYLEDVLKISPHKEVLGTTWLSLEKQPGILRPCLQKDMKLGAYKLLSDIELTDMKIEKLERIIVEKDIERYPEAALGFVTAVSQSTIAENISTPVAIGLRVYSSLLFLREGEREVEALFCLTDASIGIINDTVLKVVDTLGISSDEALFKMLYDAFTLYVSTENGNKEVENFRMQLQPGEGLKLSFRLEADFYSVLPLQNDGFPSFSLVINPEAWFYAYSWALQMVVKAIKMKVSVKGIRNVQIYNELGIIDIQQLFSPFGTRVYRGSWMIFGNYEMACKPVTSVELSFRWQNLPECRQGLKEYYKEYGLDIDNRSFYARMDYLRNMRWKPLADTSQPLYLFRTSKSEVPDSDAPLVESVKISFEVPEPVVLQLKDEGNYCMGKVNSGFYRWVLDAPAIGFGDEEYRRSFAEIMIKNSRRKSKLLPLPNNPISPMIEGMQLSYTAESESYFDIGQQSDVHFSYIRPLSQSVEETVDISRPFVWMDGPRDEGNLMIGIAGAIGENLIRLYIEMELLQREINRSYLPVVNWFYRDKYEWKQVEAINVLRDDTGQLMHSGAVVLQLPFCVNKEMTDSDGLFWMSAGIHQNLCNCSKVRCIYTNVIEVESSLQEDTNISVPGLYSFLQVAPWVGAREQEDKKMMCSRLRERISHRQRALLPHEYEQMTLREFPQIDAVKCFPGVDAKQLDRNTVVTLAIVASACGKGWPLCTDEQLYQIEVYLSNYVSPFVEVDAINPVYEEVTVFCGINLNSDVSVGSVVQEVYKELKHCIAPWQDTEGIPKFGYSFSMGDIRNVVKNNNHINQINGIKILHLVSKDDGHYSLREYTLDNDMNQRITPSVPWAILVPSVKQYITIGTKAEWQKEVELGELEIDNTFVIK